MSVSGKTITIEVYEWEDVYQLKQEVEMREGVPARHHDLRLGTKILGNRTKMRDCGDVKDRTFFMLPAPPNPEERRVEIFVRVGGGANSVVHSITVWDKYTMTIGFLRRLIGEKHNLDTRGYVITEVESDTEFHSWPLDESVTLYNHNIQDGHQLHLRPREPCEMSMD